MISNTPKTTKRHLLITGAAGLVGQILSKAWHDYYDLTLVDIKPIKPVQGARTVQADICDSGMMKKLCINVDTVIHLAVVGNHLSPNKQFSHTNLTGNRSLLNAAVGNCRRVVFASSLSIDIYPTSTAYNEVKLQTEREAQLLSESTNLSIHCLRLGWVVASKHKGMWPTRWQLEHALTHDDLVQLFTCSVEEPESVQFGVFNGISDNHPTPHDLSETQMKLAYLPQDNAYRLAERQYRSPIGIVRRIKRKLWD